MKMARRFVLLLFIYGLFALPISCEKDIPRLNVKVSNDARPELKTGDFISYVYNISHSNESIKDAVNVQLNWYLPNFLQFATSFAALKNTTVDHSSSLVKLQIGNIPFEAIANGKMKVKLNEEELHGKWQHNIVVMYQLIWYDVKSNTRKEYHSPMMLSTSVVTIPGCVEALGMANGRIKDDQLSAKTFDPALTPSQARPKGDAWCAKSNDIGDYIQIAFRKKTTVSRIVTWGRNRKAQWVTKYSINYSKDNNKWNSYRENGFKKIFNGAAGPSSSYLLYPFESNSIRIFPLAWKERICLRFEIYGCEVGNEDNCIDPVGIENGKVPDEAFRDSIPTNLYGLSGLKPSNARLNKVVKEYPFGWLARSDIDDWLQVDLGSVFKITKIAIQGSAFTAEPLFFVQTYKVIYSKNGKMWNKVIESSAEKVFVGPSSSAEAKYPYPARLKTPIYGRYFRIIPLEFISSKVMRVELYGCVTDGHQPLNKQFDTALDQHLSFRSVILDTVNNLFYACLRKRQHLAQPSCVRSKNGNTWQDLVPSVKRMIGIDVNNDMLYGMDNQLRYLSKRSSEEWKYITSSQWNRISRKPELQNATQIPDILVSKIPLDDYQWIGSNGVIWGAPQTLTFV